LSERFDVIVVGGGIEGLSTAWALAKREVARVLVLDRAYLCSAATAKSSGIVRAHYGVPALAKMALRGIDVLENASDLFAGDIGFIQTGYVVGVGPGDDDALRANVAMHQRLGIDVRLLAPHDVLEFWPQADVSSFALFGYEPRGGYGDAYLTGRAFAQAAQDAGAVIRQNAAVHRLLLDDCGEKVVGVIGADGESILADTVVLAAGPWSVGLAATAGIVLPIKTQREQILLIDAGEPIVDAPVFSDLVHLQYLRTERSGQLLVGNSDHSLPEYVDPDSYAERADDAFVDAAGTKLSQLLPRLPNPSLASSYAGFYDVTPDFNPIIGPAPLDGLFLCSGFSGHGYKIAPAVGTLVADLICIGRSSDPDIPSDTFRLSRFAERQPLESLHPYRRAGQMR
jgi:glycine/D-amino acid oxidase-like deaminating enzyme